MKSNLDPGRESKRVYLAGPDVFYPDARARGAAMIEICRQHGFEALYPLDAELDENIQPVSLAIYQANRALIDQADAVVANLRDWRGHEPDSGTVWEVAYALAQGKPVIGYLPSNETLRERCAAIAPNGTDTHGCQVEDFGLPLNLMLAHSLTVVVWGEEKNHIGLVAALERLQTLLIPT
jgi:nucleoside 2-deoxyribosyltransferase